MAPTSRPRVGCAAISTSGRARPRGPRRPSAGCRRRARPRASRAAAATSNSPMSFFARSTIRFGNSQPPSRPAPRVVVQRGVLRDRELQHEAAPLPVLGDVADPASRMVRGLGVVRTCPATETVPARDPLEPGHASISSLCPLPSTPAMPTISPARTSNETPRTFSIPRSSKTCNPFTFRTTPRGRRRFLHAQRTSRPTIARASDVLGRARARHRLDLLAPTQDGHPVGDLEHLVQLVADEDDRLPVGLEPLHDREQLGRLLGVSTAVGSSRIRISAPRYSAFRISTRCCCPTVIRR